MKYIRVLLFVVCILTLLPSCKKSVDGCSVYNNVTCRSTDNLSVEQMYAALPGTWEMQRVSNFESSEGGWVKAERCRRLTFTSDTVCRDWNNDTLYEYKYTITTGNFGPYFIPDTLGRGGTISFCNGTRLMITSTSFVDGSDYMFKRIE